MTPHHALSAFDQVGSAATIWMRESLWRQTLTTVVTALGNGRDKLPNNSETNFFEKGRQFFRKMAALRLRFENPVRISGK
jgi:hypothetical protein